MKSYKITVNGNTYEVGIEEADGVPVVTRTVAAPKVAPAPKAAPAPVPKAAPAPAPKTGAVTGGGGDVTAPMPGTVLSVNVSEGQAVKKGQTLLVFEAMKMENELPSPYGGTVKKVHVSKGGVLESGMAVVTIG